MLTVVGLGRSKDDLTLAGKKAIESADKVFVRTVKTGAGKAVKNAQSMDELFETEADFDKLNEGICAKLLEEAREKNVVYCTDGDGLSDSVVETLLKRGEKIEIVRGVSLGVSAYADGKLTVSAYAMLREKPYLDTAIALSVTEIDDRQAAGELKLYLLDFYAPETRVTVSDKRGQRVIELSELDRMEKYDESTALFIEGCAELDKPRYCFADLLRIMSRLTAPDGCPWDKAQTHESIRSNLIEEAYEAVDAIDSGDIDALKEEIGDVLLQAVFHCDMSLRTGEFDFNDVVSELCGKLYFRHTHIFGKDKATDPEQALKFWESAKAVEKSYTDLYDILCRLPKGFPSLLRAQKAVKKAVKAGLETPSEQMDENELASALLKLCRVAAASGVDAETALNAKIHEYIESFKKE